MMLYEAVEKSMNRDHSEEFLKDLAEAQKKRRDSPKRHLGLHLISHLLLHHQQVHLELQDLLERLDPHNSSKTAALVEYQAWTTTNTRLRPYVSSTPADIQMDDDMALDAQAQSSDDEDIRNAHILKVNLRQDRWKPLEEERPASPEPAWSILSFDVPVQKNNWASALASTYSPPSEDSLLAQTGPAFELVKVFHLNVIHLQYQMEECHKLLTDSVDDSILRHNVSKPLPLGGPPGQYPDVGLEQMVPDQMWIEEECKHTSEGDRRAVRTHLRILSVVKIEVFSLYGQRVEDFQLGIKSYQTQLNLTKPRWDATGFEYKHDYTIDEALDYQVKEFKLNLTKPRWDATSFEYKHDYMVIDSPRAVTFHDRYGVQMIMRFNEIHKFSDGTLHQIDEALDYWVKEFKVNKMNLGLNTRFWKRKDADRSSIYTDQQGTVVLATLFNESEQRHFRPFAGIPTVAAAGQRDVNSQFDAHPSNSLSMT
nr:hypothetical protein [Tanacetum cinerariifolium]